MRPSLELRALTNALADALALPGSDPVDMKKGNWDRWLDLAEVQHVLPLLGGRMIAGWKESIPSPVRTEILMGYRREGRESVLRCATLHRVLSIVRGVTDDWVALKGVALLYETYPEAAQRYMWDADILFSTPEQLEAAREALLADGFSVARQDLQHHHTPALMDECETLAVELHTNVITPGLPAHVIQQLFSRRRKVNIRGLGDVWVLDRVGQLIHHALHALNDPVDSPLLRNLLEVGYLAHWLEPIRREELRDQCKAWKLTDIVARAMHLAADLFGTPTCLDRPLRGAYEYWSLRCLEWTSYESRSTRLQAHMARLHFDKLCQGLNSHNPLPLIGMLAGSFARTSWNTLKHASAFAPSIPHRADWDTVNVGDGLLIHDKDTGEVHLLNATGRQVWSRIDGETRRGVIIEGLNKEGIDPATCKQVLQSLAEKKLITC